jgi:peroxiredoxin
MPRFWTVTLTALLGAALVLVVILTGQNGGLRGDLEDLQYRNTRPQAGQYVPAFRGATLDGDSVTVVPGDPSARQVLAVFTTTCPYCEASVPAWNQLAEELGPEGVPVIGISLDSLQAAAAYGATHGLRYPVVRFPSRAIQHMYRGGWVPATLVIDGEGRVLHSRMGQLDSGIAMDSILAAVHWMPGTVAARR